MAWLVPGLRRVGRKAANITFFLPSQVDENQMKSTLVLVKRLRRFGCKVALDGFIVAPNSNVLLKHVLPEYIRLSLPWTRQIQGNEAREIGLSSIIRQLESRHIQVIAPCDFSIEMKRLFTLSGASFCQERSIKNAQ
jgi:EAL domain-containing protein (putative c-di-GMP-specific phosphodiesterase class I)